MAKIPNDRYVNVFIVNNGGADAETNIRNDLRGRINNMFRYALGFSQFLNDITSEGTYKEFEKFLNLVA
jgi:hypothetical protein